MKTLKLMQTHRLTRIILIILLLLLFSINVISINDNIIIKKSDIDKNYLSNNYCKIGGDCTLNNLIVTNYTTMYTYNVTDNANIQGDLNIKGNIFLDNTKQVLFQNALATDWSGIRSDAGNVLTILLVEDGDFEIEDNDFNTIVRVDETTRNTGFGGIVNPLYTVHIDSTSNKPLFVDSGAYNNVAQFESSDDIAYIHIKDDSTISAIGIQGTNMVLAQDGVNADITISSAGNTNILGDLTIGSDITPIGLLHMHEATTQSVVQKITNSDTGSGNLDGISFGLDSSENLAIFNRENTDIRWRTNNVQRMELTNTGELILSATAGGTAEGLLHLEGDNDNPVVHISQDTAGAVGIEMDFPSSSGRPMAFYDNGNFVGGIDYNFGGNYWSFDVSDSVGARITNAFTIASESDNNWIGMGTNSPNATLSVAGNMTVGDSTNYVEIESDGDVNFISDGGMQFACMGTHNLNFDVTLPAQDTWYPVNILNTSNQVNGEAIVQSPSTNSINITQDGIYDIYVSAYGSSALVNDYVVGLFKNNVTHIAQISIHITTDTSNKVRGGGGRCYPLLSAGDYVNVKIMRTDGGAVTKTFNFDHLVVNTMKVAGG